MNKYLVATILLLINPVTLASDYGNVVIKDILSVYDGDTFRVNIQQWPKVIGENTPIRIKGVDTPEIRTQCKFEKDLAIKAKLFTQTKLVNATVVELKNIERGKYFRLLADVYIDGESLASLLINAGYGYSYDGGKRQKWCV